MSELIEQVSTSLDALTREFEIITNNLANVSTTGFKRRCNAFSNRTIYTRGCRFRICI
jgi:flagellar basal body rod protein FlgG